MDYATFNGLYTLFLIIIFVALIIWAYSKKQKKSFDNMANSIFDDQDLAENDSDANKQSGEKK